MDENLQENGKQVIDETVDDTYVSPIQYDIASYGADYDVEGLVKRLERSDILIPPFQRNYVWNQKEASRFIESLLLGLPVPGIFLAREPGSNKLLVIDGQQRLKTLQFFYDGFFNPKEEEKKHQLFKLQSVQPQFEGLTFKTLREEDRIKLNDSLIHATVIKQESPKDDDTSVYHIFDRLNSQGRRLTPQEIRTAIYHGKLIDLIKELNEYQNWRDIYGNKSNRLKDQELVLRFLALYFEGNSYKRPMKEFLNIFSQKHREANQKFLSDCQALFKNTIDVIWNSIGKQAFKPIGALNAAVFDSVMVGLARKMSAGTVNNFERVKTTYVELINNPDYIKLVSQSTSDERNVESRLRKAVEKLNGI